MRYSTLEPGLITTYQHYSFDAENSCFVCGEPTEEPYVTAGHQFRDTRGEVNEIRYLRKCHNHECPLCDIPYNPNPSEVLPRK